MEGFGFCIILVGLIALSYTIGGAVTENNITEECEVFEQFHLQDAVYDCKKVKREG